MEKFTDVCLDKIKQLKEELEEQKAKLERSKSVFEDLIDTIQRSSVDNKKTLPNVSHWANSWRREYQIKVEENCV